MTLTEQQIKPSAEGSSEDVATDTFHLQASTIGKQIAHKRPFKSKLNVLFNRVWSRFENNKLEKELERLTRGTVCASKHIIHSRLSEAEQDAFIDQAYAVFAALQSGDRGPFDALMSGRHTILIVGTPRSGGAYINRRLGEILMPAAADDRVPHVESMPRTSSLRQSQVKAHRDQAVFDFVQWALWMKRYHDLPIVPKKCSGLMYDLTVAAELFRPDWVTYLITVRHPARVLMSALDSEKRHPLGRIPWEGARKNGDAFYQGQLAPAWWQNSPEVVRTLHVWCELHRRVLQGVDSDHLKRFRPVAFGSGPEAIVDLLRVLAPEHVRAAHEVLSANKFVSAPQPVDPFWSSRIAVAAINDVKEYWAAKGLALPVDVAQAI